MSYVKLWFKKGTPGKSRTMLLEVISEPPVWWFGRKVNRFGEDNSYQRGDGMLVDVQQLISKAAVDKFKKLTMDKKYGELVAEETKNGTTEKGKAQRG